MDFQLTEEQTLLKESARDFLSNECTKEMVREMEETEKGYSPELWKKMAELGWMGLLFPEEYNGSGFTFEDLTILLDEIGYNICPAPYIPTVVIGGLTVLSYGSEAQKKEYLPKIAGGDAIFTFAMTEKDGLYDADAIHAKAEAGGDEYVINGTKMFVPYGAAADYFICVARTASGSNPEDGISVFIVDAGAPGITINEQKNIANDRQCEVIFKDVKTSKDNIIGQADKGWPVVKDMLEKAAAALCAEMLGGSRAVLDATVQYSTERFQFGVAIGSFQAVQHHCANMWLDLKAARVLTEKAAWLITRGLPASKEVAMAKSRTGESYRRITSLGHQVHGAVSFTKEYDVYLYHRRSVTGDLMFGSADYQKKMVAKELFA